MILRNREGRERLQVHGQRDAIQFVNDHVHESDDERPQILFRRRAARFRLFQQVQQETKRIIVAEIENLFLVLKIIVEIAFGHAQRARDQVHAGAVITVAPKGARRASQNLKALLCAFVFGIRHASGGIIAWRCALAASRRVLRPADVRFVLERMAMRRSAHAPCRFVEWLPDSLAGHIRPARVFPQRRSRDEMSKGILRHVNSTTLSEASASTTPANSKTATVDVSVVIPCLNEANSVSLCIDKARRAFESSGLRGEVVVADNGSTDGSVRISEEHGARVVNVPQRGYGAALRAGIAALAVNSS